MKPWKLVLALASAVAVSMSVAQPARGEPAVEGCDAFTVEVTQLENPVSGAALLTQFPSEIASAASYGFRPSGTPPFLASSSADVAVWRLYNSSTNDFTWAADGPDLQAMVGAGYAKQFAQFTASAVSKDCLSGAHRLTKANKSRIAVGEGGRDALVADGWKLSASNVFYAVGASPVAAPSEPDAFTIAVIPDTQQETWSDSDSRLKNRSQWLVDNAEEENLKFVTHVGDVVDWGDVAPAQYTRAQEGLRPLDGKIPYSLTVGNHDTAAVCQGGSACLGESASVGVRRTEVFNAALGGTRYANLKGQFEPGKVDNSFSTFEGGGLKWMVLNIELWPRQAAIDWAASVVASHPQHNVIVATHSYLNADGTIGTSNGGYGATSPKHLFDTLIKVYPNITMVVSGHVGGGASRVDTGVNGNKILSLLQTYHSRTTNPVRLVAFDPSVGTISHRVYAPFTKETLADRASVPGFSFVG